MERIKIIYKKAIPEGWISVREAAQRLDITEHRLSQLNLPRVRVGLHTYLDPHEVQKYKEARSAVKKFCNRSIERTKKGVTIYMEPAWYEQLSQLAADTNITVAALLRTWIKEKLGEK